jgi:hypothetical protein
LSALLAEHLGWRGACVVYAGIQLALALPVHLMLLPRAAAAGKLPPGAQPGPGAAHPAPLPVEARRRAFVLVAAVVTLGSVVASVISVHLLAILQARGLDLAAAVALGALVGPSQVGARIVESAFGRRYHPIWTMMACTMLLGLGIGLLLFGLPAVAVALAVYGAGNGLASIARGTVPLAMFGPDGYAALMGRLALPSILAQALSPMLAALLIERGGQGMLLSTLFGIASLNAALVCALWSLMRRTPAG